eukprot:365312-Chlamydomonas_euryale.AAC.12
MSGTLSVRHPDARDPESQAGLLLRALGHQRIARGVDRLLRALGHRRVAQGVDRLLRALSLEGPRSPTRSPGCGPSLEGPRSPTRSPGCGPSVEGQSAIKRGRRGRGRVRQRGGEGQGQSVRVCAHTCVKVTEEFARDAFNGLEDLKDSVDARFEELDGQLSELRAASAPGGSAAGAPYRTMDMPTFAPAVGAAGVAERALGVDGPGVVGELRATLTVLTSKVARLEGYVMEQEEGA